MFSYYQQFYSPLSTTHPTQLRYQTQATSVNESRERDLSSLNHLPGGLSQVPYRYCPEISLPGVQLQPILSPDLGQACTARQDYNEEQQTCCEPAAELQAGTLNTHHATPFSSPPLSSHISLNSSSESSSSPCGSSPKATARVLEHDLNKESHSDMRGHLSALARRLEEVTFKVSQDLEYKRGLVQDMKCMLEIISDHGQSELPASGSAATRMHTITTSEQGSRENIPDYLREFGTPPPREPLPTGDEGRSRCHVGRPVGKVLTPVEAQSGNRCSKHMQANFELNRSIHKDQKVPWSPWTCQ